MIDIVVRSRRRQGVEVVLHNLLQEVLNIFSINLLNTVSEESFSLHVLYKYIYTYTSGVVFRLFTFFSKSDVDTFDRT
jgi:accessory gene regulator protein AgrB